MVKRAQMHTLRSCSTSADSSFSVLIGAFSVIASGGEPGGRQGQTCHTITITWPQKLVMWNRQWRNDHQWCQRNCSCEVPSPSRSSCSRSGNVRVENMAALTCDKGLDKSLSRRCDRREPKRCESGGNVGRSSHRKCLLSGRRACCRRHKRQRRWDPWSRLDIGDPGWQVQKRAG